MNVTLYSTHCPKCNILEKKLKEKNIAYDEVNDVKEMMKLKMMSAPWLRVDDKLMNFTEANNWINEQE